MRRSNASYLKVLKRNRLSDGSEILHVDEIPPPYESIVDENLLSDNDWKIKTFEIDPLVDLKGKFGLKISGGVDNNDGPLIFITHIEPISPAYPDNGRFNLKIFDEILSINQTSLLGLTHDDASQIFHDSRNTRILLEIRRLEPEHVEIVEFSIPSHRRNEPIGISLTGGWTPDSIDPGVFIKRIEPDGLLSSLIKPNRIRLNDRLLQIQTNYTSANLQRVSIEKAVQLIRRTLLDHERITLIVAHQN